MVARHGPGETSASATASDHCRWWRQQRGTTPTRSEEHTSELQTLTNLVCPPLPEKSGKPRRSSGTHNIPLSLNGVPVRLAGRKGIQATYLPRKSSTEL